MPCSGQQMEAGAAEAVVINPEGSIGLRLILSNKGSVSVFLGGKDVIAVSGFELEKKERLELVLKPGDALYAITDEDPTTLHILRI